MNGDTNGTMEGSIGKAVPNEPNSVPETKKVNSENIANGVNFENSNNTNETPEDNSKDYKSYSSNETSQDSNSIENRNIEDDSQNNVANNSDDFPNTLQDIELNLPHNDSEYPQDTKNLQDVEVNNPHDNSDYPQVTNPTNNLTTDLGDLSNETDNGGSSEEKYLQDVDPLNNDKFLNEELCHEVDESNHSVGDSQDSMLNKNSELSQDQDHCKNGVESNHSSDESSESEEDTAVDTMSGGEIEIDIEGSASNQLENGDAKMSFKIVAIDQHQSDQEAASITLSDYSGSERGFKDEDAVSIDSDSGDDNGELGKSNESIIILENDGPDSHNGNSKASEVHEIVSDNDDCVVTCDSKTTKKTATSKKKKAPKGILIMKANDTKVELRRSSRTIKRKKYDDDIHPLDEESDVEEVVMEDPLRRKSKHSNSKSVVESAANHGKSNINQKKEINIVIIDSPVKGKSLRKTPPSNKSTSLSLNQNICQTISSRGTRVTPISIKSSNTQSTQACQTPPTQPAYQAPTEAPVQAPTPSQPILPTLTDDMFVVEAPSFIVPYVYEKPSNVPFKEFVDKLGKELEEEKAKEVQALLEKKKEEKAELEQEKNEKRESGEAVEDSEQEVDSIEIKEKKDQTEEKTEKKESKRRKKQDDDVSWDGSSSEESEDDIISDEDSQIIILKDKGEVIEEMENINEIKNVTELATDPTTKSESYFDLSLGKFFMDIGLNLVQEHVQTDLLKQQKRKLQREKRGGHDTLDRQLSIALLSKNLEMSQKANASLTFEQKKCELCSFTTESSLALGHHMEMPHMKNNLYSCNYCSFVIRGPHDILFHMEATHGVKGKLERAPALHQCSNCPFEDHGKGKLARHLVACGKKFRPETNLAPPIEWEHPAKIAKLSRVRHNMAPYQVASQFGRHYVDTGTGFPKVPIPIANAMPPITYRPRHRAPQPRQPLNIQVQMRPSGLLIRQAPPALTYPAGQNPKKTPSLSITPLPRQQAPPVAGQTLHAMNAKGFVICEICDGYIKDLEQLRNHMQWIHKVKIHPKMIYNRPPLNCQKCQFRFFTDQGLERHLLGSHGLVTSSMQEAAKKSKDAGICPVCGRVFQWKLLNHVSRDHNLTLKPAHLSYKCTVCTATFGMYRQFESHVYSAHSVVAKKAIDKKTTAGAAKAIANDNAAKQLKINDEITITPQPVKMTAQNQGK